MARPFLYTLWVKASVAILPFAARRETAKLRTAGFSITRANEKTGHATEDRSADGPLIWYHAASVGESLSVLALITRMGHSLPQAQFLITSGTATSARLIADRLPPNTVHQFAPLDAPAPLKRFLKHWRPDAAIFVESELWPQMLRRTFASGAKMALLNARLSESSMTRWRKHSALASYLFEVFDLILTQNDAMAEAMITIHAPPDRVARGVNLKSMSDPLPVDPETLHKTRDALRKRPVWVASSTHPGEEQAVLAAHKTLLARWPDLCLILAPRHPDRAQEVADLIAGAGLSLTRRTLGQEPDAQVYLADTMGELGIWYSLTDIVFLGGSLRPIGGHNPFEVAHFGAAVLSGNHVTNFAETFNDMEITGAARIVADAGDLAEKVATLLSDQTARAKARQAATAFATAQTDRLDGIATRLIKALELAP